MSRSPHPKGQRIDRWVLAFVVLSIGLGLVGIDFGLPGPDRAYSCNPDEWTSLQWLRNMEPAKFDFNPRSFEGPTLPAYIWGAMYAVAHLVGALRIDGTERYYFEHPQDLALMLLLGRLTQVLLAAGTVWLTYLMARKAGLSRGWSRVAAFFMAVHPSLVVHAHFMKVNPMVTFFCVATVLASERWRRLGGVRPAVFAGAMAGLAASSKFSGVLVFPVLVAAAALRLRPAWGGEEPGAARTPAPFGGALRELVAAFAAVLVVVIIGTPYSVLDAPTFLKWMGFYGGQVLSSEESKSTALSLPQAFLHAVKIHLTASTPPLVLAALFGAALVLWRRTPFRTLTLVFAVVFFLVALKAGHLATDSRFLPLFPFTALFAAVALAALARRSRGLGLALTGLVALALVAWTAVLETRFIGPIPQEQASEWARANLPADADMALVGKGIYWHPDLPLREFLHADNPDSYERKTRWSISVFETYAESRPSSPSTVFLTAWRPRNRHGLEWLDDPDYEVVARFPGKIHVFGKRTPVWIDFYDVDTWVLQRRDGAGGAP